MAPNSQPDIVFFETFVTSILDESKEHAIFENWFVQDTVSGPKNLGLAAAWKDLESHLASLAFQCHYCPVEHRVALVASIGTEPRRTQGTMGSMMVQPDNKAFVSATTGCQHKGHSQDLSPHLGPSPRPLSPAWRQKEKGKEG